MTASPAPIRPRYNVWLAPADDLDAPPEYVGEVEVRNVDQLTAETQAKALGINRDQLFHLTNLWIWAAMVRTGQTADKFHPFTRRVEYVPVDDKGAEPAEDPTNGAPGPSTASD